MTNWSLFNLAWSGGQEGRLGEPLGNPSGKGGSQGVKADMKGVPWATVRGSKEVMEDVERSKGVKGGGRRGCQVSRGSKGSSGTSRGSHAVNREV